MCILYLVSRCTCSCMTNLFWQHVKMCCLMISMRTAGKAEKKRNNVLNFCLRFNPPHWTATRIREYLESEEGKPLRKECETLCMQYCSVLYELTPCSWGKVPWNSFGRTSLFEVRNTDYAGKGVFAKNVVQEGTILYYGGIVVPSLEKMDDFDGVEYAMDWNRKSIIGLPARMVHLNRENTLIGFLGPTVNEPRRRVLGQMAWEHLPSGEQCNCAYAESEHGIFVVVCRTLGMLFLFLFFCFSSIGTNTDPGEELLVWYGSNYVGDAVKYDRPWKYQSVPSRVFEPIFKRLGVH